MDVPTLVIHGDSDRIVPLEASGQRTAKLIKGARLAVVEGGPSPGRTRTRSLQSWLASWPDSGTGRRRRAGHPGCMLGRGRVHQLSFTALSSPMALSQLAEV